MDSHMPFWDERRRLSRFEALLDLHLKAQGKETLVVSMRTLASQWRWGVGSVVRFLAAARKHGALTFTVSDHTTYITLSGHALVLPTPNTNIEAEHLNARSDSEIRTTRNSECPESNAECTITWGDNGQAEHLNACNDSEIQTTRNTLKNEAEHLNARNHMEITLSRNTSSSDGHDFDDSVEHLNACDNTQNGEPRNTPGNAERTAEHLNARADSEIRTTRNTTSDELQDENGAVEHLNARSDSEIRTTRNTPGNAERTAEHLNARADSEIRTTRNTDEERGGSAHIKRKIKESFFDSLEFLKKEKIYYVESHNGNDMSGCETGNQDFAQSRDEHSSAPPTDTGVAVIEIPLIKRDGVFRVMQKDIDEWQDTFPGVDVLSELKRLRQWNIANPDRRKTARGIRRHIVQWLGRAQDRSQGSSRTTHGCPQSGPAYRRLD